MKRFLRTGILLGAVLLISIAIISFSFATSASTAAQAGNGKPGPTVTVITPVVELSKTAKVVIMGSGFEPGQEIRLLITTFGETGAKANIGLYLDPEPVPNDIGNWATAFDCNRYVSKKLVTEAVYHITVTDAQYNALGRAPFAFYDAGKPSEEWPAWASAVVGSE